jgi:hypothetical protein
MMSSKWNEKNAFRFVAGAKEGMGRDMAPLQSQGHFTRSAGGYFAGMVRKHQRGELHLDRSLWALRDARAKRHGLN